MERRLSTRRVIDSAEPLGAARLRTGGQLRVIDASGSGALAETRERLLPGRHLDLHIISFAGRVLVRARVTRAYVWRLQADAIDYRAALAFDRVVDVRAAGYSVPVTPPHGSDMPGTDYPSCAPPGEIEFTDALSA